jgi:hypothetical protein
MTPREAVDHLAEFINRPSENDDREADAIEAVSVLDKLVVDAEECPTPDRNLPDREYVLADGSAWFTAGKFSVRIHLTDEGISADIFALDKEDQGTIASTYAFTAEAEDDPCPCDAGHPERCMDVGTESREREG